jgi:hypothetical protein
MLETPRAVTLVILSLLLATAGGAPVSAPAPTRTTIEPTLPLLVDMRFAGMERGAGLARGRLEIDLSADGDLDEIAASLVLPKGLRVADGAALPPALRLKSGERRRFILQVEGADDRDLPVRLDVAYRTADGRRFRVGQGVTLEGPRPDAAGRSRLGAWEVMAVPLEELER